MAQKQTSSLIDFRGLFRQYLSKWYFFVISVLVCGSLAYVYTKIKPPKYAVHASILISDDKSNSLSEGLGGLSSLFGAKGSVDDEIYVISSHSVFRQVAKDLGINRIARFKPRIPHMACRSGHAVRNGRHTSGYDYGKGHGK